MEEAYKKPMLCREGQGDRERNLTVLMCMQRGDKGDIPRGALISTFLKYPVEFVGYGEMVLRLDELCSLIPGLRREWEPRFLNQESEACCRERERILQSYGRKETEKQADFGRYPGKIPREAVLEIRVERRLYGSMQGLVRGAVTKNRYVGFRSGLELMRMVSTMNDSFAGGNE